MTNPEQDLSNLSMLDLFRLEVETQTGLLNDNLLILENSPELKPEALQHCWDALMRAAHSIKGAARIVQINPAVQLAHGMEDCFIVAKQKKVIFNEYQIDILLKGVDLLKTISQTSEENLESDLTKYETEVLQTVNEIASILTESALENTEIYSPANLTLSPSSIPSTSDSQRVTLSEQIATLETAEEPSTPSQVSHSSERVVRISAEHLNQLMSLAGEALIEANWLEPFADSLGKLKRQQQALSNLLSKLEDSLSAVVLKPHHQQYLREARQQEQQCQEILSDRLEELEQFSRRFTNLSDSLYREVIASHMRPFGDGLKAFPRLVRDLARTLNKQVKLEIIGQSTQVDRDILEKLEAPLIQILRNAIVHGIESPQERLSLGKPSWGKIRLEATHRAGMLCVTVEDDGQGIRFDHLKQAIIQKQLLTPEMASQLSEFELMEFLFLPGFSTTTQVTEFSGRGFGLDIAKSMAQEVGGLVHGISKPGHGMIFRFQLPITLSVIRSLIVEIAGEPYAFGLTRVDRVLQISPSEISWVENRQYIKLEQETIGLVVASQVLELKATSLRADNTQYLSIVVISDQSCQYGLIVDRFLGERDLVVKPLDPRFGKIPDISAVALMDNGSPVLIIDVADLVRSIEQLISGGKLNSIASELPESIEIKAKKVLIVDDSITVREMERKLLENQGYQVDLAVNGMEAWNAVRLNQYHLVISDVDMPRMNGIELVQKIKSHAQLKSLPVIIVSYKDREADRLAGLEAGANYYLTKSSFHDDSFLKAVIDLIGNP